MVADSVYDAVVEAYKVFSEYDCEPGRGTEVEVEQKRPSIHQTVHFKKVVDWAHSSARDGKEKIAKDYAKRFLKRAS